MYWIPFFSFQHNVIFAFIVLSFIHSILMNYSLQNQSIKRFIFILIHIYKLHHFDNLHHVLNISIHCKWCPPFQAVLYLQVNILTGASPVAIFLKRDVQNGSLIFINQRLWECDLQVQLSLACCHVSPLLRRL